MFQAHNAGSRSRVTVAMLASVAAVAMVLVVTQDTEAVREMTAPQGVRQPMASPDMRMQISQQLQRYDMAIKRVDDGIAQTKLNLVAQSQKLGQATQLAVHLHDKLVHDHQALLSEGARSNAMKKLRQQLAAKQSVVLAERQRLQVDALQLAEIEQSARKLLSPQYTPDQKELQAVAQETNLAPPPPLALVQQSAHDDK